MGGAYALDALWRTLGRSRETDGGKCLRTSVMVMGMNSERLSLPGSVPTARARTTATICPRSWWAWRCPERTSRCGSGPGWATPQTAPSSARPRDLWEWVLSRVIWVADRGFTSADNRRFLRCGDDHYIMGEKLCSGSKEAKAALARAGRYKEVAGNLKVRK
jgi:hypothetical protein